MVQDLILVEETAEGNDDILARNSRGQEPGERDLGDWGNLPPSTFGRPDGRGVGSNHRSSCIMLA